MTEKRFKVLSGGFDEDGNPKKVSSWKDIDYSYQSSQNHYKWIEYHKWLLSYKWYYPLTNDGKLVVMTRAEMGYLGNYTPEKQSPFEGFDIVAFGRRAYRIPTFNELYYVGYGNPQLAPEDAWLTDMAVDYVRSLGNSFSLKSKLDVFLNLLTDKITSAPTPEDPNIWAPYNIGKVRSAGFDAAAGFAHEGEWDYSLDLKYSYQSAVDRTPDSYTYGQQIPYIARHVVVLNGNLTWNSWSVDALWQMRAGRTDGYGELPDWNTLDLNMSKAFSLPRTGPVALKLTVKNIFDCRYETVSGYPMPGRSVMGGIEYVF